MSDPRPPASSPQRLAARLANAGSRWFEGYELGFMEELVRTYGLVGTNRWSLTMLGVRTDLVARYGLADAQVLMAFAAFWQGCTYCSRGHLLAGNLVRFRDDGTLFPLDTATLVALQAGDDDAILSVLRRRLADHADLLATLERQHALRDGVAQRSTCTDDDELLQATHAVWGWLSECSIMVMDQPEVPPLCSEVAGDDDLLARYRAARAAHRRDEGRAI